MNTTPERGPHRTIRSVEIAFDIVDALQERDRVVLCGPRSGVVFMSARRD